MSFSWYTYTDDNGVDHAVQMDSLRAAIVGATPPLLLLPKVPGRVRTRKVMASSFLTGHEYLFVSPVAWPYPLGTTLVYLGDILTVTRLVAEDYEFERP